MSPTPYKFAFECINISNCKCKPYSFNPMVSTIVICIRRNKCYSIDDISQSFIWITTILSCTKVYTSKSHLSSLVWSICCKQFHVIRTIYISMCSISKLILSTVYGVVAPLSKVAFPTVRYKTLHLDFHYQNY